MLGRKSENDAGGAVLYLAWVTIRANSDVVKIAKMVVDVDVVEHAAEALEGNAHAVGPAEAAELAAAFDVRFQIEEHAGDAAALELLVERSE